MLKVAIVGFGNLGRYALKALADAPDMECAGIVRRSAGPDIDGVRVVTDIRSLGKVDVAILSVPSRQVEQNAAKYLAMGINTVDSFDIHTDIWDVRCRLDKIARENNVASIISAGWDPGSDSIVRALLQTLSPAGTSYTNFGPGRSMGHTVAVKAIPGVRDALSMTLPAGKGVHDRKVYIELEDGYDFETVAAAIKADPYFVHDKTDVELVESVEAVNTLAHGVNIEREGCCSGESEQKFGFTMRINNPALTSQILVQSARAVTRRTPGCYTMIEVPVIDFLPGSTEELVKGLV